MAIVPGRRGLRDAHGIGCRKGVDKSRFEFRMELLVEAACFLGSAASLSRGAGLNVSAIFF